MRVGEVGLQELHPPLGDVGGHGEGPGATV
jgi:hypothetical protein